MNFTGHDMSLAYFGKDAYNFYSALRKYAKIVPEVAEWIFSRI